MFDLVTHLRTAVADINSRLWEYQPTISPGYFLFGRNSFKSKTSPWKIMLYDRTTHITQVLDTSTYRCSCLVVGQVSDQYATWYVCSKTDCFVKYYDIAGGGSPVRVPDPDGKVLYSPSVSSATGDLYYFGSGNGCGVHVVAYRWNPTGGVDPVKIATLPAGYDAYWSTFAHANTDTSHDDVNFGQLVCSGNFYGDIYKLGGADTAAPVTWSGRERNDPWRGAHIDRAAKRDAEVRLTYAAG